jgi:UDP-2-acetamido-2-deoxy-ribo-hexuluronate aminotransferase
VELGKGIGQRQTIYRPMNPVQMVDLQGQYLRLKSEIDPAIKAVVESSNFIQGPEVRKFSDALSEYLGGCHVITCGNGTDALQVAMMALGLKQGDEVIVAEVIALLGLTPVLVDVDERTFNIDASEVERRITDRTKAIVPVHLFGQCSNMADILGLAAAREISVIEDAAQSLGATYTIEKTARHAGTLGRIGITSFFPTKTLGCFGDGGALFTSDAALAETIRMIANHGQRVRYTHDLIGINSRLDTIQAAVLRVKLRHIADFTNRRRAAAAHYDAALADVAGIARPHRDSRSSHVFHQYTIKPANRDALREFLRQNGIPSMVYYPMPLHFQKAYQQFGAGPGSFPVAEKLSKEVISLPIHTEMDIDQLNFICSKIRQFYNA